MQRLLFLLSGLIFLGFFSACQSDTKTDAEYKIYEFGGPAQGTSYVVKYHGAGLNDYQESVDSILKVIDQSLSTYIDQSTISEFNREQEIVTRDQHFIRMVFDSRDIRDMSNGAFDPAVMPLVKAWGFGPEGPQVSADVNLDSLLNLVDWDFEVKLSSRSEGALPDRETTMEIIKKKPVSFDFNGIAQGYTVDVIWEFLRQKGIEDMLIEIGGELRASGVNERGSSWAIGIDDPLADTARGSQAIVLLDNKSVATSGNYRKFYEKDGKRYAHTIDPQTGIPVTHQLLSATVVASSAALADAFATVFMVYGPEKSMQFFEENPDSGMDAYLIYHDESGAIQTWMTEGFSAMLRQDEEHN